MQPCDGSYRQQFLLCVSFSYQRETTQGNSVIHYGVSGITHSGVYLYKCMYL